MDTDEWLANQRTMKLPAKIELLDMAETTNQKVRCFAAFPLQFNVDFTPVKCWFSLQWCTQVKKLRYQFNRA